MNDESKRVFIVKNKGLNTDIAIYAENSYTKGSQGHYNTMNNSINEEHLKDICHQGDKGIILLVSYQNAADNEIKEIYIGSDACVNDKWNIDYIMRRKLTRDKNNRAIQSIIDKIELDIDKDFDKDTYIMVSKMESLYDELYDRLKPIVNKQIVEDKIDEDEDTIADESYTLCKLAQHDSQSRRIKKDKKVNKCRSEFQKDRERIVNCKAFRRLVDKAQIFSAEKGDYFRTRMTHTLEVNQISKAISYALRLNLDLTEAIALSHDLGHTPFGHQGERTLDYILTGKIDVGIKLPKKILENGELGEFKHNYQSAKILTKLEDKYVDLPGLDVSIQVIEGALKHTKLKENKMIEDFLDTKYTDIIKIKKGKCICATLEGQVVAIADEIAQRGHDVDDALTSGVMSIEELLDRLSIKKCMELLKKIENEIKAVEKSNRLLANKKEMKISRIVSCIINYFIEDVIECSNKEILTSTIQSINMDNTTEFVKMSDEADQVNNYLEKVVQKKVICNCEVARADYNASEIISTLFRKYYINPRLLHTGTLNKIFYEMLDSDVEDVSNNAINLSDGSIELVDGEIKELTFNELFIIDESKGLILNDMAAFVKRRILIRNIVDYIAGMTDGYAIQEYQKLK